MIGQAQANRQRLDERIREAWKMFEDAEPDISTERLIAQVGDFCKVDNGRVVEGLARTRVIEKVAK